jgi:hypothetical protein
MVNEIISVEVGVVLWVKYQDEKAKDRKIKFKKKVARLSKGRSRSGGENPAKIEPTQA